MRSFVNYRTEFTFAENKNGSLVSLLRREARVCFAALFSRIASIPQINGELTIYLYRPSKDESRTLGNDCVLSLEQIELYLSFLKGFFNINFETNVKNDSMYSSSFGDKEVYLEIKIQIDESQVRTKLLLTLLRYLYEHPYAMVLVDSIKMYNLNLLSIEHHVLFNYMHIASFLLGAHGTGHSYCGYGIGILKSEKAINESLKAPSSSVNGFFKTSNRDFPVIRELESKMRLKKNELIQRITNYYQIADDKEFTDVRLPIYKKAIEEIYKNNNLYETN